MKSYINHLIDPEDLRQINYDKSKINKKLKEIEVAKRMIETSKEISIEYERRRK